MTRFLLQRLAETAAVLLLMSFLIYGLIGLMPGDPIDIMINANPDLTPADAERLRKLHGLDQPIVARYWAWLTAASRPSGRARASARAKLTPISKTVLPSRGHRISSTGRANRREYPRSPESAAVSQVQ